ncbi:hypothetical protein HMPREF0495_01692 [Levilactobacillus brevis ATCC 14869 = DSM 20054]|uniref:Uncharacterized protein n=1 Tax=Levilactobacillus brevis ATCC 14869 = DSM 20054 TaxID=649758 RepID=U2NYB4_LEVBR|nr:hypothetical protein HMPREF0495_01692 [Levilactobacillus brevis ATCC 14869 = DSM 20054]
MKELNAKAGIATVRATLVNTLPKFSPKVPRRRRKKPRRIIKMVDVMELIIAAFVNVDSTALSTLMVVASELIYLMA